MSNIFSNVKPTLRPSPAPGVQNEFLPEDSRGLHIKNVLDPKVIKTPWSLSIREKVTIHM